MESKFEILVLIVYFYFKRYGYFGRIKNVITRIKEGKYLSKAMGMRDVIIILFQLGINKILKTDKRNEL